MQGLYYLAETSEKFTDNYGDDWVARFLQKGIPTAILGMVTVFVVLALIWGCLEIFRYVFYTIPEKAKHEAENTETAEAADTVGLVAYDETDDGEVVAAIVAAITAMRADEAAVSGRPAAGFKVVSFRKR